MMKHTKYTSWRIFAWENTHDDTNPYNWVWECSNDIHRVSISSCSGSLSALNLYVSEENAIKAAKRVIDRFEKGKQ